MMTWMLCVKQSQIAAYGIANVQRDLPNAHISLNFEHHSCWIAKYIKSWRSEMQVAFSAAEVVGERRMAQYQTINSLIVKSWYEIFLLSCKKLRLLCCQIWGWEIWEVILAILSNFLAYPFPTWRQALHQSTLKSRTSCPFLLSCSPFLRSSQA